MTCSICRFWGQADPKAPKSLFEPEAAVTDGEEAHEWSLCRRHSPVVLDDDRRRIWPISRYDDWCGEFEDRPVTESE